MPSRLSSLLVRDGLVGVKRMEKAFQRQVIYGGTLDTILLEMTLVPEDRLTQYLALASGLPPAARDEGHEIPVDALALVSRDLAEQYRAVPLAVEGEAVRILVCAPLEISALEDLADLLDRPLQPLITPEYRWHLVYAHAYGLDPPARFTTLARTVETADVTPPPVGRARSIIIDERTESSPIPTAHSPISPVAPDAATLKFLSNDPPVTSVPDDAHRSRRHTIIGVVPNRAQTDSRPFARPSPLDLTPSGGVSRVDLTPSGGVSRVDLTPSGGVPRQAARQSMRPLARPTPIPTEGRDAPLPVLRAREILATAEDRDTVFLTLLRAARSPARWAGLLTVQGGAAIGRVALAEPGLDTVAIQTILIPLDVVSPFRTVVTSQQSHIGPLSSGDQSIDAMVVRMGGTVPPSALIMPVVLRDRVVALVVAHRVHSDLKLVDVTELLPMATAASDALGRLIVRHKSAGYRAPSAAPVIELEADMVDTKRLSRPDLAWRAPDGQPSVPGFEQGVEMSMEAGEPRPIEDVMTDIENAKETQASDAITEAVERASETLGALMRRFPGKLRVDRFAVTGRPLRAAQYGGMLELVIRMGAIASELLIDKMAAPQRDVRFYATVCAAELRPRNAVYALAERLFDQDFGVRASAVEALSGYPAAELGTALVRARRAVHSSDPDIVAAATGALVSLGDVDAIPDLIGVIERADRGGEHARRALVALTAQDFGPHEKKWRKWHDSARRRHRIEWLVEGLTHKEDPIRELAINELRRLTGEYFGYHHDLPRRERDLAAERWVLWWRETGHRRYTMSPEDERHRPTAELPIRRTPPTQ